MQESLPALKENEIARTALGFLKVHYRQRNRIGHTELSSDLRGAGGIVADGFLRYPMKGGKFFMATVEATSEASKEEVRYKIQRELVSWDAAAIASVAIAVSFAVAYLEYELNIRFLTYAGTLLTLIIIAALLYGAFRIFLSNKRRYRYIYAIEQFKQYYADEQWIALAEDVFPKPVENEQELRFDPKAPSPSDPYTELERRRNDSSKEPQHPEYQELRRQCIQNGIGLLMVPREGPPVIKITPSREDLFKNKRKRVRLFSQEEIARFASMDNYPEWMRGFRADNLLRFQKKYKYQLFVCLLSALIVGAVFYKDSLIVEEIVVDYEAYVAEMEALMQKNRDLSEPIFYYVDTPYVWPRPIRQDVSSYALNLGLEVDNTRTEPPNIRKYRRDRSQEGFVTIPDGMEELIRYDCARLYNLQTVSYIVQVDTYGSFEETAQRIGQLRQYGFDCNGLLLECFDEQESGYAVYFGLIFRDLGDAQRALQTYDALLGDNVLGLNLKLRSLSPRQ